MPTLTFGPYSGEIMVADENNNQVHAIASDGTVTYDVFDWIGAEGVIVIPSAPCTFCSGSFYVLEYDVRRISQYPPTDFTLLGGNILVTSEYGAGTALVTWDGSNYNVSTFDNVVSAQIEGSSFADCDVPEATPTPTATATAIGCWG